MAATKYTYTISVDFPQAKVVVDRLEQEVQESAIVIAIDYVDTEGDACDLWFKDSLSTGDQTVLDGLVAAHTGEPFPDPSTADGLPLVALSGEQEDKALKVALVGRIGSEALFITHNLCDPTTWYTRSVREVDKILTDSGNGLIWNSGDTGWIDILHGEIFEEDIVATTETHGFAVEVKVDAVVKTMRTPFADSGGDYEVNYASGDIVFYVSQAGKTVMASYSRQDGSEWVLAPTVGKYLDVEMAEVQFSKDVVLTDDVDFEIWVYNPADLPNRIMYSRTTYRHFRNFVDEALGSYPVVPAMGGAKRGIAQDVYGFPFRYGTVRRIDSAVGAELRVRLRNDVAFGGEFATATFYCTSHEC